jgi:hypothetical protein
MKPVKQKIDDDCFRACIASMLELPNSDSLPHISSETWFFDWNDFLKNFGIRLDHDYDKIYRDGFWVASVLSLNNPGGYHAIIMKDKYVEFDPSNLRQYEKGRDLLQEHKIVHEGYWLEIDDISKLKNLDLFREGLNNG